MFYLAKLLKILAHIIMIIRAISAGQNKPGLNEAYFARINVLYLHFISFYAFNHAKAKLGNH